MYGKVNDKIDVFAFGVVLLELLSGRKPISNEYPEGQESLVMWVWSLSFRFQFFSLQRVFVFLHLDLWNFFIQARPILNGGKFAQILDPSLGCGYDCDLMERMMLAATLCIRRSPRARPHMSLVSPVKLFLSLLPASYILSCEIKVWKLVLMNYYQFFDIINNNVWWGLTWWNLYK